MHVQGYFDLQFQAVKEAFAAQFSDPQQRGAALCVQVAGETVLDIWAGEAGPDGAVWQNDTLANLFSCSKTFTAVAVLQLVAQGKIDLDAPLAKYWPEFVGQDKAQLTVRQVLAHQAGLPALREVLPGPALYEWSTMVDALAAESPWWLPGSAHGYAPITYGWLLGELLRRVTGMEPGEAVVASTVRPLGLDFHIGLAESEFHRVAHISRMKGHFGDAAAQRLFKVCSTELESMTSLAFANPPAVLTSSNRPEWRRMQQPAANGHGNARSLAGFFAALLDGRLLAPELLAELTREHCRGDDLTLLTPTRFGLGCMLDQPDVANATFGLGAQAFGHPGAGGSLGFADPERGVAFAYVTNSLGPYVLMDPRAQQLARVLGECL